MGTIPVATPTPPRSWRLSRRVIALGLLAGVMMAGVVVSLAVLKPSGNGPRVVDAGRLSDLRAEQPVYHAAGFFLVKLDTGEVIALSEIDPHQLFGSNADCPITWRPEMQFEGATGWLRGTCSGNTFTLTGEHVSGPSPRGMDRFPVAVSPSGEISVDTGVRSAGARNVSRSSMPSMAMETCWTSAVRTATWSNASSPGERSAG
ncbi:MAG TPA: hypothetical protein VMR52_01465 [Dehalococcoidia bacterium]|nr:hypothetical protein [Dehalococcoidia bacterium]